LRYIPGVVLARKTGYSEAHVSRVRRGNVSPSVACARALAREMGMTIDEFLDAIKRGEFRYENPHSK